MAHYRAIVSIEFDDEELEEIFGPGTSPSEAVNGGIRQPYFRFWLGGTNFPQQETPHW